MASPEGAITHVSDTALMVAACRALDYEEEDSFVRDSFAARLAGERGMALLRAAPHGAILRFGIAVRSHFVDELVLAALAAYPIVTVLSVGCGLDTRPWRLDLPADLRWIEVDFADMLDYKERLMAGETPRCRRETLGTDLNDAAQRRALFEAAGAEPALMITEGLLIYLQAATVEGLAAESWRQSGVAHWITDLASTAFNTALLGADPMKHLRPVQPGDALTGEQIFEVIERHGWSSGAHRSYITDAAFARERIRRMFGDRPAPSGPPPIPPGDPTGVHRFARTSGGPTSAARG